MNQIDFKKLIAKLDDHERRIRAFEGTQYNPQKTKVSMEVNQIVSDKVSPDLDFSIPIRAFIRKYANGMGGPQKFVLSLAYLSRGEQGKCVSLSEIEKQWNRMTSKTLLGVKFNRFYPAQGKEKDWVESKKQGEYNLRPLWKEIFP